MQLPVPRFALGLALILTCPALLAPGCGRRQQEPLTLVTAAELLEVVRETDARALLVNVWSTSCLPCREELPELLRLRQRYGGRGFELVLVSADFDTQRQAVLAFLAQQKVDFPTYMRDEEDRFFVESMSPRWTGALPASFLYDGEGSLVRLWQGQVSFETLEQPVLALLGEASPQG